MRLSIVLILLLSIPTSLHSFSFSRRWIAKPQLSTKVGLFPDTHRRNLDEVYIGNLPSTFNADLLKEVLSQRHIDGYCNVSVSSYGTSEGDSYGRIKFASSTLAESAVRTLQDLKLGDTKSCVSLMPNVSRIHIQALDPDAKLAVVPHNENIIALRNIKRNNELVAKIITCISPPHAARLLTQLVQDWKGQHVKFQLHPDDLFTVTIDCLDSSITEKGLTAVMTELLGHGQFARVSLPNSRGDFPRAYVRFIHEEQMNRAVEILKYCKLMDKAVRAVPYIDISGKSALFISNIDPTEPAENVERLCNEAVGATNAVVYTKAELSPIIGILPTIKVFFFSDDKRNLCATKLNGLLWKGRILSCSLQKPKCSVYVRNLPASWSEAETNEAIKSWFGDAVLHVYWKREYLTRGGKRYVYVHFALEDQAKSAIQTLNRLVIQNIGLFAASSTSYF